MIEIASVEVRVLLLAPTGRDAELLCKLLERSQVDCLRYGSMAELCAGIREGVGAAIVAEEALSADNIEQLAAVLAEQGPWSDLPLIVLTSAGEVTTSSEKRRRLREPLGNVVLLERPVRPETLLSTVKSALRARKRQYETRHQLHQFRQAEEAMRRAEKLAVTGRLAASIAHEINNPLEAVTNLLFLLRTAPAEERGRYLSQAEEELARVTEITRQTLRFYREPARPVLVNVADSMESVLRLFQSRISRDGIAIRKSFFPAPPVLAGEGELRQVFSNLIGNALDAMKGGGTLTLRVRCGQHASERYPRVYATIADTGTGIPAAIAGKIYEPFVSTKEDTGTGLGLWVTAEIIARLSGRIRVRSRCEGPGPSGTAFIVRLPGTAAS